MLSLCPHYDSSPYPASAELFPSPMLSCYHFVIIFYNCYHFGGGSGVLLNIGPQIPQIGPQNLKISPQRPQIGIWMTDDVLDDG